MLLAEPQHTENQGADLPRLPYDLGEAIAAAQTSEFVQSVLTPEILQHFVAAKQEEWQYYQQQKDKAAAEEELYFGVY